MEQNSEIKDELQQIGPILADAGKLHPFSVPVGYFEKLPASIISRIALGQTEVEEELSETPLLRSIPKTQVYSTPQGYFDQAVKIRGLSEHMPAKVTGLTKYRRLIQYAAAAVLGGLLVTGAFMFTDSKDYIRTNGTVEPQQISSPAAGAATVDDGVSEKEPNATVQKLPFAKKVELLSDDELQNYLEENAPTEPIQITEDTSEEVTTI